MTGVDDEGPEIRLKIRLETSRSVRTSISDFLVWCDILLRLAIFMAIAGIIITIGLVHNFAIWLTGGTRRIT